MLLDQQLDAVERDSSWMREVQQLLYGYTLLYGCSWMHFSLNGRSWMRYRVLRSGRTSLIKSHQFAA